MSVPVVFYFIVSAARHTSCYDGPPEEKKHATERERHTHTQTHTHTESRVFGKSCFIISWTSSRKNEQNVCCHITQGDQVLDDHLQSFKDHRWRRSVTCTKNPSDCHVQIIWWFKLQACFLLLLLLEFFFFTDLFPRAACNWVMRRSSSSEMFPRFRLGRR
jgi:hypothetical protein